MNYKLNTGGADTAKEPVWVALRRLLPLMAGEGRNVVIALVAMARPLGEKWLAAWRPFALLPRVSWRWPHRVIDGSGQIGRAHV
mgnify:FL=1